MRRRIVRSSSGSIFNRITILVIACVLSFLAGAAYTKADMPIILSNPTVTEMQTDIQSSSDESEVQTESHQPDALAFPEEPKSEPAEKWRIVRMKVTGYCPCSKCCGKHADGITANGHKIQPGDTFVAADKRFSFGTEMVIEGYNNGQIVKVLDRGGAIKGNKLDAFFHTHQEALEWGVRYIDVKVRDI
ncbi:MAG: 3D domain-containing protein [Sedimentisphaerales bacterium]|nr:3D domain-containing protein [Sedimentisphaerales bacterium]